MAVEYRWAGNEYERLPALAAELVRRCVAVIVAPGSTPAALAVKSATATIPIVFGVSDDPVKLGLVANLARPGGNATGINFFVSEAVPKRLGLLRDLVPGAIRMGAMVTGQRCECRDHCARGAESGRRFRVENAGPQRDAEALFVAPDFFFHSRRVQLATLAARNGIPATYANRDYAEAGGLMSYGTNVTDSFREVGVYVGRILKGKKPADLPVTQPTKFEFVINLQTARALGLDVAPGLLVAADEVIE